MILSYIYTSCKQLKKTVKKRIFLILIIFFISISCGIFKTHHKDKLIDFENNSLTNETLKLNGYYFSESEIEYGEDSPLYIDEYIKKTGINKIKYISAFFIYEDGFTISVGGINGISHYYCAEKTNYENTFESAHKTIEILLKSQNSDENKIKRNCGFEPNDIGSKGLIKIKNDSVKIQTYVIESQLQPGSANSAYLYEMNGIINSDSSFVIKSQTRFRNNKTTSDNTLFKFRKTEQKPNIKNYFKEHQNKFK